MIDKTFDEMIVERLKRSAVGFPYSDGRPISRFNQLLAQGALTSRAVQTFDGTSLFAVVNGLHTEAFIKDHRRSDFLGWNMHLPGGAVETFFSTVMGDIVTGRLVVREPLNFLRCNDLPELKLLPDLICADQLDLMAIMVRYAVKKSEAISWLNWHGIGIPDWLEKRDDQAGGQVSSNDSLPEHWSDCIGPGKIKLRQMFDAIQVEIEGCGYTPTSIPHGGIKSIQQSCEADHPKLFNAPSSFDNAWRELVKLGKVRSYNHVAYGGKADSEYQGPCL